MLPKSFTTVTTLSKALAAVLFITFPFLGFYLGMQYEKRLHPQLSILTPPAKLPARTQPTPASTLITPPAGCRFEIDPNSPCKPCPADQPACRMMNCAPNKILVCPTGTTSFSSKKNACETAGGKWLEDYNECESMAGGLDEKTCKDLGGTLNACDSACRHDPNPGACIEVCINVCKF